MRRALALLMSLVVVVLCQNGVHHQPLTAPIDRHHMPCFASDDASLGERGKTFLSHHSVESAVVNDATIASGLVSRSCIYRREPSLRELPLHYVRCILCTQAYSTTI